MVWFRWMSYSFVLNIGDESIFMISSIRNNLGTPVRQFNTVLTMNYSIFILSFSLSGVSSIVIYCSILVGERLWWFLVTFITAKIVYTYHTFCCQRTKQSESH